MVYNIHQYQQSEQSPLTMTYRLKRSRQESEPFLPILISSTSFLLNFAAIRTVFFFFFFFTALTTPLVS
jgi:hypothetical protein